MATIAAARPVLEAPEILVVGSEVPNRLQPDAASTLVVSQDLDVGVPVNRHGDVKQRLPLLLAEFVPSPEEPSVWTPRASGFLDPELRRAVRSNLTVLSLLDVRVGIPDPRAQRALVAGLLRRLDALEEDAP